jgi:heat-inducible transcriptional repressor
MGLDLSPATIRNVMADLEEMGLIRAPHTSAGRVPTERGYRVFIDTLLQVKPLESAEVSKLRCELDASQDPQQLIECASHMLSEVSKLAGLVVLPRRDDLSAFRHIDFVALSAGRLLVIIVTQDGQVHNRIVATERDYSDSELTRAANYFNETYSGMPLAEVKRALVLDMRQTSEDLGRVMQLAVAMATRAFAEDAAADDLVVSGESNLMEFPELGDVRKLRRLFDAFNTKRDLLQLLDQSVRAGGVKIFIGSESGYEPLADCSLVTAPYAIAGEIVGTLGVLGPTRIAYEHVIPIVDITARLLSSALSHGERGGRLESPEH